MTVNKINRLFKEGCLTSIFIISLSSHNKSRKMDNEAYANVAAEFDDDCFNHHRALNIINEDKKAFIATKTSQ